MPRQKNSPHFRMAEIEGRKIAALIGISDGHESQDILVLLMLLQGKRNWHRLFLDARIGFWEKWNEKEAFEDFVDLHKVDYGEQWNLFGETIRSANCFGTDETDPLSSKFEISLRPGKVVYRYADALDIDSPTILEMWPPLSA